MTGCRFPWVALLLAASVAVPSAASASGGQAPGATDPNPLVGQRWWDQNTPYNFTWNGFRTLSREGRAKDAADVRMLAEQPRFRWWGRWERPIASKLRKTFA